MNSQDHRVTVCTYIACLRLNNRPQGLVGTDGCNSDTATLCDSLTTAPHAPIMSSIWENRLENTHNMEPVGTTVLPDVKQCAAADGFIEN